MRSTTERPLAPRESIDTADARELIATRAVRSASIVGQPGGWSVYLQLGANQRALAAQRSGNVRVWRSLDRCVTFMRDELGLAKFDQLDATRYAAEGGGRKPRADAASRLKRAHAAAEHDQWFRAQVNVGLRELDAGDTVTEAAHDRRWARRRAALRKRVVSAKPKG